MFDIDSHPVLSCININMGKETVNRVAVVDVNKHFLHYSERQRAGAFEEKACLIAVLGYTGRAVWQLFESFASFINKCGLNLQF